MAYNFNVLTGKFDRSGEGTVGDTGSVTTDANVGNGSASLPSYHFSGSDSTGIYYDNATSSLGLSAGGQRVLLLKNTSLDAEFSGNVKLGDGGEVRLGDTGQFQLFQESGGTNLSRIYSSEDSNGLVINSDLLKLKNEDNNEDYITCTKDAGVVLYFNNSPKLETLSYGISTNDLFNFNGTGGKILLANGGKIQLGSGPDLEIYHDGSHSYIANTGGNLYITEDGYIELSSANGGEKYATFNKNGAVELYWDDSKKLETMNTGAKVTGQLHVISGGNSHGLYVYKNSNISAYLGHIGSGDEGYLSLRNGGTETINLNGELGSATFSGNVTTGHQLTVSGEEPRLVFTDTDNNPDFTIWANAEAFKIYDEYNNATRLTIDSSGNATFSGIVTGERFINATDSADPWLKGVNSSGTETSYIKKDGTAYFAGDVKLADDKGINFSAYVGNNTLGNGAGNTLKDYEEGTWTPQLIVDGNSGFTSDTIQLNNGTNGCVAVGWYTKIGNLVKVGYRVRFADSGKTETNGSRIYISGLPFSAKLVTNTYGIGSTGYSDLDGMTNPTANASTYVAPNQTKIDHYKGNTSFTGGGDTENGTSQQGKSIYGNVSYHTA